MHRVDGPGNVAGHWVGEDPENEISGTQITADIMEALQEEICAVVESRGKVLNKANNNQLLESILEIASGADLIARYATTGNIVLAGDAVQAGGDWPAELPNATIVLVRAQTIPQDNGPYVVNATGTWSRLNTFDSSAEIIPGKTIKVTEGVTLADSIWMLVTDAPIVLNSTALIFERKDAIKFTLPTKYRTGFELSNNVAAPNTTIDIAIGKARDESDNIDIILTESISKILQSAGGWTLGSGGNGLFSGVRANSTWYHVFLIINESTGVVDAGFDTSIVAANRPAGWAYRYLNSIRTNSSGNILSFLNYGLTMDYKTPIADVNVSGIGAGVSSNYTVSTPPGMRVRGKFYGFSEGGNSGFYLHPTDTPDILVDINIGAYVGGIIISSSGGTDYGAAPQEVLTDISSQIRHTSLNNASSPTTNIKIVTCGWTLINQ